jgi:hypothetical protein
MAATALTESTQATLRRRAIRLEYFTVGWNVVEAAVALVAGGIASSIALVGFGLAGGLHSGGWQNRTPNRGPSKSSA